MKSKKKWVIMNKEIIIVLTFNSLIFLALLVGFIFYLRKLFKRAKNPQYKYSKWYGFWAVVFVIALIFFLVALVFNIYKYFH